jgi:flagellar motor switch protein FliM
MHETFARLTTTALSAQLRSMAHVHVASVDQLTYEEFIRSIPTPTTLAVINMDPLKGNAILEIDPSITFSIIDRPLRGTGQGTKVQRDLTDIETSVMEGIIAVYSRTCARPGRRLSISGRLGQIETNPPVRTDRSPVGNGRSRHSETKVGEEEGMMKFLHSVYND